MSKGLRFRRFFAALVAAVLLCAVIPLQSGATAYYTVRTTEPGVSNAYYRHTSAGGLNECIKIADNGYVLPNCVGYCWGRAYEVLGGRPNLSRGHANQWYSYNINSKTYGYGTAIRVGAIACYSGGKYGHVLFVEEAVNGKYRISESAYSGGAFSTSILSESEIKSRSPGGFQGFIYLDAAPKSPNVSLDVNLVANGIASNVGHDSTTFDVWINGQCAADDVKDFYHEYNPGCSYEVNDIKVSGCFKNVGQQSYSGTLNGNTVVTISIETAHTVEIIPAVEPTCTETGLTEGSVCSVCGEVLTAQEELSALGHDFKTTMLSATCADPARFYKTCERCGEVETEFVDDIFTEWSEQEPPADAVASEKKTQYRSASAVDQWTQVDSGSFVYAASWPAGFDRGNPLFAQYNKTPVQASETGTERVVVNTAPAGYIYWHWCYNTYANGPDNRKISSTQSSTYPGFHAFVSDQDIPVTESAHARQLANRAVCTDTWWWLVERVELYTCTYTKYEKTSSDEWSEWGEWQDEEIAEADGIKVETREVSRWATRDSAGMPDHIWDAGTLTKAPTCTQPGEMLYVCAVCKTTRSEAVPATEHKAEKVVGKAATCTETGLTDGEKCAVCGEVLTAQEVIPALGHTDPDADGKCSRCGEQLVAPEPPTTEPAKVGYLPGDVDRDGKVTSTDARLALRAAAKLDALDELGTRIADMDGDGNVTSTDARVILRIAAKLDAQPDKLIYAAA